MNNATSHLSFLLCKSLVSKYMIMVRSVTRETTKKIYKKLISHYHYGVVVYNFFFFFLLRKVVYNFMHPKKWNIKSFLKGMCKDSLYVCVYKGKKRVYLRFLLT